MNVEKMKLFLYFWSNIIFLLSVFSDIPADDILELFGKTFFEFCQDSGYDKILQVLGATPRDFLQVTHPTHQSISFYFFRLGIISWQMKIDMLTMFEMFCDEMLCLCLCHWTILPCQRWKPLLMTYEHAVCVYHTCVFSLCRPSVWMLRHFSFKRKLFSREFIRHLTSSKLLIFRNRSNTTIVCVTHQWRW